MNPRPLAAVFLLAVSVFTSTRAKASAPPSSTEGQQGVARPRVDLAFVLDTTGSMGGLIEGAKQKIWSIASRIARGRPAPLLRIAVVAYRDVGDTYVVKRFELTRDLDAVYAHLKTLDANGGGDTPEHVGRGLGEAVKHLAWSEDPNTMKMLFVVGDAPPKAHRDGWDADVWADRAAKQGIVVNTIRCGGDITTEVAFQRLARRGEGTYASIDGSGGVAAVHTPYDVKLAELNAAIASRTLYSGGRAARGEAEKKAKGVAAMAPSAAADRIAYAETTRSGGLGHAFAPPPTHGAADLTAKPKSLALVGEDDLPAALRGLGKEDRQRRLDQLADERRKLEERATKVAQERDEWMRDHVKDKEDSFDGQVMKQIRNAGARHGIAY